VARSVKSAPNPEADESLPYPIVVCDEPAEGATVSRGTVVGGWAYSPAGIRKVSVWLGEWQVLGRAELGLERPDVAHAHPEWTNALRSGFGYRLEAVPATAASAELDQSVEFKIVAEDGQGRQAEMHLAVQIDESLLDPIIVCDEPEEGSEVSLGTVVGGWAYGPAAIKEVSVWLDGLRVGLAELGLERPDVAEAYPEWPGALRSGFSCRLDALPVSEVAESAELMVAAVDEQGRRTEVRRAVRRGRRELLREKIESQRQELRKINNEAPAAKNWTELVEHRKRKKRVQQQVFQLKRELRATEEGWAVDEEPVTGALPDYVVIGAQKCGTTYFYHLLTQHPYVEPAAAKELHFFDIVFDLGVEWYRRCFPTPGWIDGRRTITGEATPYYLFHPHAAKRMARVIPQARLIALLRNPVDRAYSLYHQQVRKGLEDLKFEEAIEAEEARMRGEMDKMLEDERYVSFDLQDFSYLSRGIYVDQLLRWSGFFGREQMFVLKSEDFFDNPRQTLKTVFSFLELPAWEPQVLEPRDKRDKARYDRFIRMEGGYEEQMAPATRRRLEAFFEPHNRRLYEYLGKDFGW
jgi:Sulfotransferase domain